MTTFRSEETLVGFVAGAVAGMTGVGGGILFVPALAIFLDEPQLDAEATSLLAIVAAAIAGTWRQLRFGNVHLRDGLLLGALSPLGVAAGVVVANSIPERALELSFAVLLVFVAGQLLLRAWRAPEL